MAMVGKKLLCLFLFAQIVVADVDLFITDLNDDELSSVAVGQPFLIHVSASDVHGNVRQVEVDGLDLIGAKRTSVSMSTFNGRTSAEHVYQATINRVGSYVVGPARITDQDGQHVTDALTINVGTSSTINAVDKKKVDAVTLCISTENNQVYVGQRVPIEVDLSYASGGISLNQFYKPDYGNCIVREVREPKVTVKKENGKRIHYASYEYSLFPQETGELIIPSHTAIYTQRAKKARRLNFLMASFGFDATEQKQVHSNALTLKVKPLPPHNTPVDAVGRFSNFSLVLDATTIKQHDLAEVTISIVGDGDLHGLSLQKIDGIDKTVRSFFSSDELRDLGNPYEVKQKIIKYALQPTQDGEFIIPSQTFTYFDPYDHQYKTLQTQVQTLVVEKCDRPKIDVSYELQQQQKEIIDDINHDDGICVVDCGPWCAPRPGGMSHLWFLFLMLFPLLLLLAWLLFMVLRYGYDVVDDTFAQKNAFKRLHKQLKRVSKNADSVALVYPAFMHACAKKWQYDLATTPQKTIVEKLNSYLLPSEREQFEKFLIDSLHATYGDKTVKDNDLVARAMHYAIILHERILKKDAKNLKNKGVK